MLHLVSVQEYMEKGYLPEVMINFLALLGWNPGTTQEIFTHAELIEQLGCGRKRHGECKIQKNKQYKEKKQRYSNNQHERARMHTPLNEPSIQTCSSIDHGH
jgi:glutamyl-tRNA synthetase